MRSVGTNSMFQAGERPMALGQADEAERVTERLISHFGMQQFIGTAPSFLTATQKIPRIAACDVTVLLVGETGTGKEMCARVIHQLSPRANGPFVPVDCGSIPPDLFENELFGHEPGAYTDARRSRQGLIAEAEGGTLLLDEVEALSALAQVKLLRFLQEHTFKHLIETFERAYLTEVLAACDGNISRAAREAQKNRRAFFALLKKYGLLVPDPRCTPRCLVVVRRRAARSGCEHARHDE